MAEVISNLNNGNGILFVMEPEMFTKTLAHIHSKYDSAISQGVVSNFFGISGSPEEFANEIGDEKRPVFVYKSTKNPSDMIWARLVFEEIGCVRNDEGDPFSEDCYLMEMPGKRVGNYAYSHFMVIGG